MQLPVNNKNKSPVLIIWIVKFKEKDSLCYNLNKNNEKSVRIKSISQNIKIVLVKKLEKKINKYNIYLIQINSICYI